MSPVMTLTCAWAGAATQIDAIKTALQIKAMAKALQAPKPISIATLGHTKASCLSCFCRVQHRPKRLPAAIYAERRERAKHRGANRRCLIIHQLLLGFSLRSKFG